MTTIFILSFLVIIFFTLPGFTTRLRNYMFTRINGKNAHHLPNKTLGANAYRSLYESAIMTGRSQGSKLANVVWYLLAPGSHLHQETMEDGDDYRALEATTKKTLTRSAGDIKTLITKSIERYWTSKSLTTGATTYLRDAQMPIWASFFYELIFDEPCTDRECRLIVANARNFINTTKFCELRNMPVRHELVQLLEEKIAAGKLRVELPARFSIHEKALHLRGIYFTSGVSQMSEAAAHTLICLAENRELQQRLATNSDRFFLNNILNETFRMFPLFGVAFRIAKQDAIVEGVAIDKGAVICFNYSNYQKVGYVNADVFDPDRWMQLKKTSEKFMPFGQKGNHSCPAQGIATIALGITVQSIVQQYDMYSSASHTRALVNRGPCILIPRGQKLPFQLLRLIALRAGDQLELSVTSLKQLLFGAITMFEAQRLKLAARFHAGELNYEEESVSVDSRFAKQTAS